MPALLEHERHDLVRQHVHRVRRGRHVLDPARAPPSREQRHRLQQRLRADRQKNVQFARVSARRPVRPRRCRNDATDARRVHLDHLVQVPDVDAQLHRRGADDGRVLPARELLLRQRPVRPAHRAVVDEHLHPRPARARARPARPSSGSPRTPGSSSRARSARCPRAAPSRSSQYSRRSRRAGRSPRRVHRAGRPARSSPAATRRSPAGCPPSPRARSRWMSRPQKLVSRSSRLARWAPRSSAAKAWTSSTITTDRS